MAAPSVISIGTFDGVHLGHRAILQRARRLAEANGARVVVFAFDPHPTRVLRPAAEPPRLVTCDEKVRRLHEAGADRVILLQPTRELLGQTAESFIESLVAEHHPVAIIEGPDFRFGKARRGDMKLLEQLGKRFGFEVHVQPPVEATLSNQFAITVSSSAVRWLVGHGRMLDATICLGQPHVLTAPVVIGDQRGRTIDVPTANLDPDALREHLIPPDGVYAGTVLIHEVDASPAADPSAPRVLGPSSSSSYTAALSIGTKPTFGDAALAVEAHLLDFAGDLYGRTISIQFVRWLRDQVRFPDLDSLKAQLQRDIDQARRHQQANLLV